MNDDPTRRGDPLHTRLALDDRPGPAPRLSKERSAALVSAALDAWAAPEHRARGVATRARSRAMTVAAVALLGLAVSAAAAHYVLVVRRAAQAPATRVHERAPAPPEPVPAPAAAAEPAAPPAPPASVAGASPQAEDLLQRANRLRASGRFEEAAASYAQVDERHPRSLSAYVANVAAGALELEHLGRPARARRLFERALRAQPDGALDIEARQGLALALRDLGDAAGERRALEALVAAHPQSPAAQRARLRLRELAPTTD